METNFETFLIPNEEDMWTTFLKESKATGLRKLLPQSLTSPMNYSTNGNSRKWKILYSSTKVLAEYNEDTPAIASIDVRTRNDSSTGQVPERLYSSLKYEVTQEIPSHIFVQNSAVMMSKIQVVNPYNYEEEILKNNGKSIVKGTCEFIPLTLNNSFSVLFCKTKIQFTDVSYHHEKKYFALKVSYYDPNNLNEAIFVQMSAPFQVFARRPRRKSLKRKSTSVTPLINKKTKEEKVEKIVKLEKQMEIPQIYTKTLLDQFLTQLDILSSLKEKLSENEEKLALDALQKKFFNHSSLLTDNLPELDFFSL